MKISVIYPVCSLPVNDPKGFPHPFLLTSLNSVLTAVGDSKDIDFEILIGVDGQRTMLVQFLRYWIKSNKISDQQIKVFQFDYTASWGNHQRNSLMPYATGDYITFMDHDDRYCNGIFKEIQTAAEQHPGRPLIFKMHSYVHAHTGAELTDPMEFPQPGYVGEIQIGRIGGHQIVCPNIKELLGIWPANIYEADFHFIRSTVEKFKELGLDPVWINHTIAQLRPYQSEISSPIIMNTNKQIIF